MRFDAVYYEPDSLHYPLGRQLHQQFASLPWIEIETHNRIDALRQKTNAEFPRLKRCLIVGTRKTHKYSENEKISDFLVPFTSSGCTASCLYCYLVCNYNKCAYLRLFVNREQMLERLLRFDAKAPRPMTFEIGSNSDLVLENTLTKNLEWVIPTFAQNGRGFLTFPTKFSAVEPLLHLNHGGKTIFRMSVNPEAIIRAVEFGTAPLSERLRAVNAMHAAGYPCGILIAPVILMPDWQAQYTSLLDRLASDLDESVKQELRVEIIFMTYSYVHRAINREAFPNATDLFDPTQMRGSGRGKYRYHGPTREFAEVFLRQQVSEKLPHAHLVYVC